MLKIAASMIGAPTLAAMALAGCSTGTPQVNPWSLEQGAAASGQPVRSMQPATGAFIRGNFSPTHGSNMRSWMAPDAHAHLLLYVSDINTDDVSVYDFPKGTLVGSITGFGDPSGLCADKMGNVWVTDYTRFQVLEFAHGATSPSATINTSGAPYSCAVNLKTGDLAVGERNNIAIYKHASGTPQNYQGYFSEAREIGYAVNTLYISGFGQPSQFEFASLKGGQITPITITGATINFPGSVQYADGSLTLGDASDSEGNAVVYQLSVSGTTATATGTTELSGNSKCYQSLIWKHSIVATNYNASAVDTYKYPAGGSPRKSISGSGLVNPFGLALSK
jgi:hypothetical protein